MIRTSIAVFISLLIPAISVAKDNDQLAALHELDQNYYWQTFDWMMENGESAKSRQFKGNEFMVTFTASSPYKNQYKQACRRFTEKLKRKGELPNISRGVACKEKEDVARWCKMVTLNGRQSCKPRPAFGIDKERRDVVRDTKDKLYRLDNSWQQFENALPSF